VNKSKVDDQSDVFAELHVYRALEVGVDGSALQTAFVSNADNNNNNSSSITIIASIELMTLGWLVQLERPYITSTTGV
jgi:hypothetical protein